MGFFSEIKSEIKTISNNLDDINHLTNEMIDIYKEILTDPTVFRKLITPSANEDFNKAADFIGNLVNRQVGEYENTKVLLYISSLRKGSELLKTKKLLGAFAKNNKYGSVRFVIYKDGTVVAADSEHFTHHSMAPSMGAWDVRGYVEHLDGNDYVYKSMDVYNPKPKDHPVFKKWEQLGIENGNDNLSLDETSETAPSFKLKKECTIFFLSGVE